MRNANSDIFLHLPHHALSLQLPVPQVRPSGRGHPGGQGPRSPNLSASLSHSKPKIFSPRVWRLSSSPSLEEMEGSMPKPVQKHLFLNLMGKKVTTITRPWQFFWPPIDGVSGHFQSSTTDVSKDFETILLYRIASQVLGPSRLIPVS